MGKGKYKHLRKMISWLIGKYNFLTKISQKELMIKKNHFKSMISVSLILFGYWGKNIAKVVFNSQNMYLDAIVDISQENQNNAKNTYPNIKTYSCLDDLLFLNIKTVVIIATPVHTHYLIVKECLERGHHVL